MESISLWDPSRLCSQTFPLIPGLCYCDSCRHEYPGHILFGTCVKMFVQYIARSRAAESKGETSVISRVSPDCWSGWKILHAPWWFISVTVCQRPANWRRHQWGFGLSIYFAFPTCSVENNILLQFHFSSLLWWTENPFFCLSDICISFFGQIFTHIFSLFIELVFFLMIWQLSLHFKKIIPL